MIAIVGAVLLASAGTGLVLMLVLQKTIAGEGGGEADVPREEDPARFERNVFVTAFLAATGAILLLIGTT
jgi:hypothetical protein